MSTEPAGIESNKPKSKISSTDAVIKGAWIGFIGVVLAAVIAAILDPDLITIITNRFNTSSPTIVSQAATSQPATPTFIINPSETPIDIPKLVSPTAIPFNLGDDWKDNCISNINWRPYLAGESITSSDCYKLVNWGIAAYKGTLIFNRSGFRENTALEYGILTDVCGKTRFEFAVQAIELISSEIWLAFLESDTTKSEGVAVVLQHDNNFDVRPLPKGVELVDNIHFPLADGEYDSIVVEFKGATISVVVDKIKILEHPVSVAPNYLFLGYRALPNAEINANIYNVEIE